MANFNELYYGNKMPEVFLEKCFNKPFNNLSVDDWMAKPMIPNHEKPGVPTHPPPKKYL